MPSCVNFFIFFTGISKPINYVLPLVIHISINWILNLSAGTKWWLLKANLYQHVRSPLIIKANNILKIYPLSFSKIKPAKRISYKILLSKFRVQYIYVHKTPSVTTIVFVSAHIFSIQWCWPEQIWGIEKIEISTHLNSELCDKKCKIHIWKLIMSTKQRTKAVIHIASTLKKAHWLLFAECRKE